MESDKRKLHHISEWEEKIKKLPGVIEFVECKLDHGNVTSYTGKTRLGKRERLFTWHADGRCYYRNQRVTQLDIKF